MLPFGVVCLLGVSGTHALAAPPQRIHGEIGAGGVYKLPGNIHRIPAAARDAGPADPSLALPRITLHLAMTSSQQTQLKTLLRAQQTRGNSRYHKWLTPEQFAERFGASESDIQKISAWLENQGFSDIEVARSRTSISFSGMAAQAEAAFGTALHRFRVNGTVHYANLTDPVLPAALKGIVEGIRGLNDFHPKPHAIRRQAAFRPRFTSSVTGSTFLTPGDFATIYDVNPIYNSGLDGTGETIAVAGQSDIQLSDIEAFRSAAGLPFNDPQVTLFG
ncbi:MAG: S53 family peptidase, partial [Bryobacteraceae bacterium]